MLFKGMLWLFPAAVVRLHTSHLMSESQFCSSISSRRATSPAASSRASVRKWRECRGQEQAAKNSGEAGTLSALHPEPRTSLLPRSSHPRTSDQVAIPPLLCVPKCSVVFQTAALLTFTMHHSHPSENTVLRSWLYRDGLDVRQCSTQRSKGMFKIESLAYRDL